MSEWTGSPLSSDAIYHLSNVGALSIDWSAYVDTTPQNVTGLVFGKLGTLSNWFFQQPFDKGGMWRIKHRFTGLYFGYSSNPAVNDTVQAVNTSEEIYWDIWPFNPNMPGIYKFFVPNTILAATLSTLVDTEPPDVVNPVFLTDATHLSFQEWVVRVDIEL